MIPASIHFILFNFKLISPSHSHTILYDLNLTDTISFTITDFRSWFSRTNRTVFFSFYSYFFPVNLIQKYTDASVHTHTLSSLGCALIFNEFISFFFKQSKCYRASTVCVHKEKKGFTTLSHWLLRCNLFQLTKKNNMKRRRQLLVWLYFCCRWLRFLVQGRLKP